MAKLSTKISIGFNWHVFAINKQWQMFRDDKVIYLDLRNKSVTIEASHGELQYNYDSMYTGMTLAEATEAIKKWNSVAPDEVVEKIKAIQDKIKE